MKNSLGIALIVLGLIQLVANEPVTRLKRAYKPWWRDDDPVKDAKLSDYLRASVFAGGIAFVEVGIWMAEVTSASWGWRVALYGTACIGTLAARYLIRTRV